MLPVTQASSAAPALVFGGGAAVLARKKISKVVTDYKNAKAELTRVTSTGKNDVAAANTAREAANVKKQTTYTEYQTKHAEFTKLQRSSQEMTRRVELIGDEIARCDEEMAKLKKTIDKLGPDAKSRPKLEHKLKVLQGKKGSLTKSFNALNGKLKTTNIAMQQADDALRAAERAAKSAMDAAEAAARNVDDVAVQAAKATRSAAKGVAKQASKLASRGGAVLTIGLAAVDVTKAYREGGTTAAMKQGIASGCSIGGAFAAGATVAAVCSVVPGIGTVAGWVIGFGASMIGSFLGETYGKKIADEVIPT